MSLVWHIARKDLRRLRVSLVLWGALIAAKLGVGALLVLGIGMDQARAGFFDVLSNSSRAMAQFEALIGYLLVASVVHDDLMVGTTAFWMTRPISGVRMLLGKAATLGVIFGVIPLAITLPWWIGCGYGFREVAIAAAETSLWHGVVVLVALPLATLTNELARFLLWSVVVAGLIVGWSMVVAQVIVGPSAEMHPGLLAVAIGGLIFVVGGGVSAAYHFCTRRFWGSVAILGASVVLALSATVWPWRFSVPAALHGSRTQQYAPGIQLTFRDAQVRARTSPNSDVYVGFRVDGVPPELVLGGLCDNRWMWPGGLTLEREGEVFDLDRGASWLALGLTRPHETSDWVAAFRNGWIPHSGAPLWRAGNENRINAYVSVPAALPERVRKDPPSYVFRAELQLARPIVIDEKPARADETIASKSEVSRVVDVQVSYVTRLGKNNVWSRALPLDELPPNARSADHRIFVFLAERGPGFFGRMAFSETDSRLSSSWPRRDYFLLNRTNGSMGAGGGSSGKAKPVRVGTVAIVWRTLQFRPPQEYLADEKKWRQQPDWLTNLTLAKLKWRVEEQFTTEVRVDRFTFTPWENVGGRR